jgi:protein O-GlcNAc transferase
VNHAKFLIEQTRGAEGLVHLQKARAADPMFAHTDAVYAGLRLNNLGDVEQARYFQLRAWLANFDNLRLANCFLFYSSYADIDERVIAAEHRFWAETLQPIPSAPGRKALHPENRTKKIKIGYWSPDLRNHSVRYFFRPLQINHDRAKFEIIVYHDSPFSDGQTELIKRASDQFHSVFSLTDTELASLIESHHLDILVELAGHTSNNRVNLLQKRLARLQMSALGYPPTTGLTTIDAKLVDRHIATEDAARYYSERPVVLPTSFWCFDPMEDDFAVVASSPPCVHNGYITFGCVGNIAKINKKILLCWATILKRIPRSRILVRAITFDDPVAQPALAEACRAAGLPMSRVDFRKAEGGKAFFESYNDIDIILDTSPFNGGTTSCFAVYMGVPVVTWAGDSLIGRMGNSIMSNVGRADWVAKDADGYVRKAVELSQDVKALKRFKSESRDLMRKSGLGNGQLFAREFESACLELLAKVEGTAAWSNYSNRIDVLPANELVRRAYEVLSYGQTGAGKRILDFTLRHYPDCASAHILMASAAANSESHEWGAEYLLDKLKDVSESDRIPVLTNVARQYVLADAPEKAALAIEKIWESNPNADLIDQLQADLWKARFASVVPKKKIVSVDTEVARIRCLIACDDDVRHKEICGKLQALAAFSPRLKVSFARTEERTRCAAYLRAQESSDFDAMIVIQKNIDIHDEEFFSRMAIALQQYDVVGYAGATRWAKLDWSIDSFEVKAAGFLTRSTDNETLWDLIILGPTKSRLIGGMAVLDGGLLGIHRRALRYASCNEDYVGADAMLEQAWSHSIWQAGGRLAVDRGLCVGIHQDISLDRRYWSAVRSEIAKVKKFNLFEMQRPDRVSLSVPVRDAAQAKILLNKYFEDR